MYWATCNSSKCETEHIVSFLQDCDNSVDTDPVNQALDDLDQLLGMNKYLKVVWVGGLIHRF